MVNGQLRRRDDAEAQRAATLELFYDLVFVFAITQVSHLLLDHLTWVGAGQAAIVLLAVWWSWNYTTWATNELNPETNPVRLLLIALMLGSLLMAIAVPHAFGKYGLLFAVAYLAIQVGRHAFLTFVAADRGSVGREQAGRILVWFLIAGVFWISGGMAEGGLRAGLWLLALALDYIAPRILFPLPGRPRLAAGSWRLATGHFTERFGLFVIAAIGETIILTGATTAGQELDPGTVAAFISAFAGSAALWWLYFRSTRELSERSLDREASRTGRARDIYTYGHVLVVAGIILAAVGDELVIAHPLEPLGGAELIAVVAGPVLFLLAQVALQLRAMRRLGYSRLAAITACAALGLLGCALPALLISAALVAVLIAVALLDQFSRDSTHGVYGEGGASRTKPQQDRA
ncbi:low temperature requirement protein A [Leifsonia sp. PS1209]|uniref:low temperature requirement protein A n=1 Tax=Leifsonia sp. PS1209 TaxID=2724914 RepID=UPI001B33DCAA|nr:low temperature requirement protein A [Leifsonia sp. PS1209]